MYSSFVNDLTPSLSTIVRCGVTHARALDYPDTFNCNLYPAPKHAHALTLACGASCAAYHLVSKDMLQNKNKNPANISTIAVVSNRTEKRN